MQRKTTSEAITELLTRATQLIASGEKSLRTAAETIAGAQSKGATQRQIAAAVGKSVAWVNQLLKWRQGGYVEDTAFGPQSKASRQRAQRVHSAEQKTRRTRAGGGASERAEAASARARAQTARADAARTEAEARKASAEAAKAEASARAERAREEASRSRSRQRSFRMSASDRKPLQNSQRERLVKILGMLGSDQAGERDNAACSAERQRKAVGMSWDDLIIAANEVDDRDGRRRSSERHAPN